MDILFKLIVSFPFVLVSFFSVKALNITPRLTLFITVALLTLATGYVGINTSLSSIFGFEYQLNYFLQSIGIGALTALFYQKQKSAINTGITSKIT